MRNNTPEILKHLNLKCFENQSILENSKKCGCFYCLKIFTPAEITNWINDAGGKTALCPYCMIDSVIPESDSGDYELNTELLKDMNKYWILKYLYLKSFENQSILENSKKCGCFYCLKIFTPAEITNWVNDVGGKTALCPYCMIDSVIPESDSGDYELNTELLKDMNKYWF